MKQNRQFDEEKALYMAGNLSWTCPIEARAEVNKDWQLMETNIRAVDEHCVPMKRFYPSGLG